MRIRHTPVVLAAVLTLALSAGAAGASASSLGLAVSSATADQSGFLEATVTASGVADPNMYGSDELDLFTAPSGSTCGASASAESASLGFPTSSSPAYPAFTFVRGTFSQKLTFDSATSAGASYVVCGYLTVGSMYPTHPVTVATTQTVAVLAPTASATRAPQHRRHRQKRRLHRPRHRSIGP